MVPEWTAVSVNGRTVMRFGLLEARGIRHGMVVKNDGCRIDDRKIYQSFSASGPTVVAQQTHSTKMAVVESGLENFFPNRIEADGLITFRPRVRLTIHTADCVPVFLAASDGRAAGLFHCGWRGTADGFLSKAVLSLDTKFGIAPESLLAVIGPCIEAGCYLVGSEVAEKFSPEVRSLADDGKWFLDLREENRRQLLGSGLKPDNIQVSPLCTRCRPDLFHSYRREGAGLEGKMVSFIEAGCEEK